MCHIHLSCSSSGQRSVGKNAIKCSFMFGPPDVWPSHIWSPPLNCSHVGGKVTSVRWIPSWFCPVSFLFPVRFVHLHLCITLLLVLLRHTARGAHRGKWSLRTTREGITGEFWEINVSGQRKRENPQRGNNNRKKKNRLCYVTSLTLDCEISFQEGGEQDEQQQGQQHQQQQQQRKQHQQQQPQQQQHLHTWQ